LIIPSILKFATVLRLVDELNPGDAIDVKGGRVRIDVPPRWARVMRME
jgi:hypothetical protein